MGSPAPRCAGYAFTTNLFKGAAVHHGGGRRQAQGPSPADVSYLLPPGRHVWARPVCGHGLALVYSVSSTQNTVYAIAVADDLSSLGV